jgi:superfamily II DNA or RNA helicase
VAAKGGKWDGYFNFLSPAGFFATGLAPRLARFLEQTCKLEVRITDKRFRPKHAPSPQLTFPYKLREEQVEALEAAYALGGMTFHAATNSGKTDVAIALAHRIGLPAIFLTHRRVILRQTHKRLQEALGETVGVIGDDEWSMGRVTIAMVETLRKHLATTSPRFEEMRKLFLGASLLVWDECHRSSNGDWWKVAQAVQRWGAQSPTQGPYWSLAMSGTADCGDDLTLMRLEALSGPVGSRITNKEQIEKGYSAQTHVVTLNVTEPKGKEGLSWQDAREPLAFLNPHRNLLIAKVAKVMADFGLPCFLATENKATHHPPLLQALLKERVRVGVLTGSTPTWEREAICQGLREGRVDLILSTTVLDEGWDVPNVYGVFDAGTQASPSATLQRVGRGIRKKENNNLLHFVMGDWTNTELGAKSKARLALLAKDGAFKFYSVSDPQEVRDLLLSLGFSQQQGGQQPQEGV